MFVYCFIFLWVVWWWYHVETAGTSSEMTQRQSLCILSKEGDNIGLCVQKEYHIHVAGASSEMTRRQSRRVISTAPRFPICWARSFCTCVPTIPLKPCERYFCWQVWGMFWVCLKRVWWTFWGAVGLSVGILLEVCGTFGGGNTYHMLIKDNQHSKHDSGFPHSSFSNGNYSPRRHDGPMNSVR